MALTGSMLALDLADEYRPAVGGRSRFQPFTKAVTAALRGAVGTTHPSLDEAVSLTRRSRN